MPISIDLKFDGPTHKTIIRELRHRVRMAGAEHSTRMTKWRQAEETMVAYVPETDLDAKRRTAREDGEPNYTTIMLPYTYAVVLAAHTYWTTVFLGRTPVHQFAGLHGEGEMQVQALEAMMQYNLSRGYLLPNYYIWFQDVGKYGEGWIGNYWDIETRRTSEIVKEQSLYAGIIPTGKEVTRRVITEVKGYQGNKLFNISPTRVLTDPRVPRGRFQEGEFVSLLVEYNWNRLVKGKAEGRYINLDKVDRRGANKIPWTEQDLSGESPWLERPEPTDLQALESGSRSSDVIRLYETIIEIIPSEWKVGTTDLPEKWVFTVTADFKTIIEARPLGCLHDRFPLEVIQVECEGYATFTRGLVEIFQPIQQTLDWLINSHFFNVRAVLNNQLVFDPSRVEARDIMSKEPGKRIRLKPAAYGQSVRDIVHQLDVNDVTRGHLNDMAMVYGYGERLGINDQVMGIGAPSSRRTAQEVRATSTFSVGRLKTIAEWFSATGFSRNADMMVSNAQQYYDGEMKLKIVGDLADMAGPNFINVTPDMIAGAYEFVHVDGTLPIDRFAQGNLWREMLLQISKVPGIMGQYDIAKIFAWVAQLMGLKNINQFKLQLGSPQQLAQQAQAGNVVPMKQGGDNPLEPGQIPQLGPTA